MATSAINPLSIDSKPLDAATKAAKEVEATADRFLKLLVTQMQNQDPLNPMDNAQVTSQMAQINTVSGIEKLNNSVQALSSRFIQMQALQGAALVGHDVTVTGNQLAIRDGVGTGGFELTSAADRVKVEVLNGAGLVIDTLELGAHSTGQHSFNWPAKDLAEGAGTRFRVTASSGAAQLSSTALMRDTVTAVSASPNGDSLSLELARSGVIAYGDVKAFN
jgi:flagellar basal-body rod modification protein FlgD